MNVNDIDKVLNQLKNLYNSCEKLDKEYKINCENAFNYLKNFKAILTKNDGLFLETITDNKKILYPSEINIEDINIVLNQLKTSYNNDKNIDEEYDSVYKIHCKVAFGFLNYFKAVFTKDDSVYLNTITNKKTDLCLLNVVLADKFDGRLYEYEWEYVQKFIYDVDVPDLKQVVTEINTENEEINEWWKNQCYTTYLFDLYDFCRKIYL